MGGRTMIGKISEIGTVSCLGDVQEKPSSTDFFYAEYALEGTGFVVMLPDNTYGRIFVDSWGRNSAGAVTELHLTWQYSF